ncbi:substrate-binding domain-containing protein [Alienimonas sp. DA493]|uniref:AraC family transcriptional regulator n=1 Tax=Alienimonas sp. DA493 TaxID=3373605 RepID=UPI00375483E3
MALLVPQELGYGRGVCAGVQEVAEAEGWSLRQAPADAAVLPMMRRWCPHGVVAHLTDASVAAALRRGGVPAVNVTSTLRGWRGPLVEADHEAVGRLAAEHFLDRGFRHFGYLGSAWAGFSLSREEAFRRRLGAAGFDVSACHLDYLPQPPADRPWDVVERDLRAWLTALPRPAAVFASNDRPAREAVEACRSLGFAVPEEIAVLGVDDDEFECRMCRPALSSVANPSVEVGRRAAAMLATLIAGGTPPDRAVAVPPPRVVTRGSSDATAVRSPGVRAAVRLIREEACRGLNAAEVHRRVAAPAGRSRRQLEREFRAELGRTVLAEILRVRVERARSLLAETDLDVAAVAAHSGFADARRLAKVFRDRSGQSPTAFRAACR